MICMAGPVQKPTAFLSQDHCLLTFWKRFRELGRDDVHLFIVPDRSLCRKNGERAEYRLRTASVIVPGGVLQSDFWSFRETFACN